jgi:hypothetical protein
MMQRLSRRIGRRVMRRRLVRIPAACLLIFFLGGCAILGRAPSGPPLSDLQAEEIVDRIRQEGGRATSFYTRGALQVKDWYFEEESSMVMVGSLAPFRVKIEVTHGWGQPILHILVDRGRLEVLSFMEGRLYMGDFTPEALSRFIPGPLDTELIWAVLRGYPAVIPYARLTSPQANRIDLLDTRGQKVETLELGPEGRPSRVILPLQKTQLTFSGFEESEGVVYAGEVGVDQKGARGKLTLRREKVVFNRPVPNEVFTIEKPPTFTVMQLEKEGTRTEDRGSRND